MNPIDGKKFRIKNSEKQDVLANGYGSLSFNYTTGWAELVSDTCPIHSYFQSSANACDSCHLTIPLISKPSRWNSSHLQTIQTIG